MPKGKVRSTALRMGLGGDQEVCGGEWVRPERLEGPTVLQQVAGAAAVPQMGHLRPWGGFSR